jgi:hypothetical protein
VNPSFDSYRLSEDHRLPVASGEAMFYTKDFPVERMMRDAKITRSRRKPTRSTAW